MKSNQSNGQNANTDTKCNVTCTVKVKTNHSNKNAIKCTKIHRKVDMCIETLNKYGRPLSDESIYPIGNIKINCESTRLVAHFKLNTNIRQ